MPDYKITRISEQPPREWANPKGGTVYYRNVMLDGWEKPVSVGKKSPDALQVGMTISGTIERTGGETDKWHGAPMGSFGGGGASQAGSVAQERVPFKADPDRQAEIKAEWAIGQAVAALKPHDDKSVLNLEYVESMAKDFFAMVDRVKGGSNGSAAVSTPSAPVTTQAAENPQSATTSSGYDKFKQQGSRLADKREDEAIHETLMEQQGYEDLPADW